MLWTYLTLLTDHFHLVLLIGVDECVQLNKILANTAAEASTGMHVLAGAETESHQWDYSVGTISPRRGVVTSIVNDGVTCNHAFVEAVFELTGR